MAEKEGKPLMEPDAKLKELMLKREALKQEFKKDMDAAQKELQDAQRKKKSGTGKADQDCPNPCLVPTKENGRPAARSLSGLWCSIM